MEEYYWPVNEFESMIFRYDPPQEDLSWLWSQYRTDQSPEAYDYGDCGLDPDISYGDEFDSWEEA